jgi:hypothetical protein
LPAKNRTQPNRSEWMYGMAHILPHQRSFHSECPPVFAKRRCRIRMRHTPRLQYESAFRCCCIYKVLFLM